MSEVTGVYERGVCSLCLQIARQREELLKRQEEGASDAHRVSQPLSFELRSER